MYLYACYKVLLAVIESYFRKLTVVYETQQYVGTFHPFIGHEGP